MKVALLNYSGNVGKTTLARDFLKPRMPDHKIVTVESYNADGKEELIIKGEDNDMLYAELISTPNLILDVGSANLGNFLFYSEEDTEMIECIDKFIIPTTPDLKQQHDTGKTIESLIKLGVQPKQIFIIANQITPDPTKKLEDIFEFLIQLTSRLNIDFNLNYAIRKHQLYLSGKNLSELLTDEDFRSQMEDAIAKGELDEARKLASKVVRQKRVFSLNAQFQEMFENMFGIKGTGDKAGEGNNA